VISRRRCFFGGLLLMGRTRTRVPAYAPQRQGRYARRHRHAQKDPRATEEDEKKVVEAKALSVIGAGHAVNELTVAPPSKNHKG